jgi:hypothetical protein
MSNSTVKASVLHGVKDLRIVSWIPTGFNSPATHMMLIGKSQSGESRTR